MTFSTKLGIIIACVLIGGPIGFAAGLIINSVVPKIITHFSKTKSKQRKYSKKQA